MKLVSIDVGIRNFSFCCFELPDDGTIPLYPRILDWRVLNLSGDQLSAEDTALLPTCDEIMKSGKKKNTKCGKRATMQRIQTETNSQSISTTIPCYCCNVHYKKYAKQKQDFTSVTWTQISKPAATNAKKVDLTVVGRNIKREMDKISALQNVDKVIVENQIGPLAIRMKAVQGMVSQYFIMRNENVVVDEISACNKLKKYMHLMPLVPLVPLNGGSSDVSKQKKTRKNKEQLQAEVNANVEADAEKKKRKKAAKAYKGRKELSVIVTRKLLAEQYGESGEEGKEGEGGKGEWITEFEESGKKDDRADSFLQGLWYIEEILLKEQQKHLKQQEKLLQKQEKQNKKKSKQQPRTQTRTK